MSKIFVFLKFLYKIEYKINGGEVKIE